MEVSSLFAVLSYSHFFFVSIAAVVLYSSCVQCQAAISRRQTIRQHACKPPTSRHRKWDLFGLDVVKETIRAFESKTVIARQIAQFHQYGATFSFRLFLTPVINTVDPENVKQVLSKDFSKYSIGARRQVAFEPLVGRSVFQVEGFHWKRARGLYTSCLTKSQMEDVGLFEKHIQNLLSVLFRGSKNGQVVDLADWFPRLTADVTTDCFFGLSIGSLASSENEMQTETFLQSIHQVQIGCERRWKIGVLANWFPQKDFRKHVRYVHAFINGHIQKAIEFHQSVSRKESCSPEDRSGERRVFLHELCKLTTDRQLIHDELIALFIAGVDTTAALLTNLFFVLAKRPDVWRQLREEAKLLSGEAPTIHQIRALKYHEGCIMECVTSLFFFEACFFFRLFDDFHKFSLELMMKMLTSYS